MLTILNSVVHVIQFTYEAEVSNKLPFLDMLITCMFNKFYTCVYHKPFSVSPFSLILNHVTSHPKKLWLSYFDQGTCLICSDDNSLVAELNFIRSFSINHGFSLSYINYLISHSFNKCFNNPDSSVVLVSFSNLIILPFYNNISFKIANTLRSYDFKFVFKPPNKLTFHS